MSQANDLSNQVCVITGAARGIGQEMAVSLAERGAHVVVLARDERRVGEALAEIRARAPGGSVEGLACDLSSIASIKRTAAELQRRHPHIDLLVNNAAVFHKARHTTVDGLEVGFAVNTLAPYLLTRCLEKALRGARVVNMSMSESVPMRFEDPQSARDYSPLHTLKMTKTGAQYITREMNNRYRDIDVVCVDPGMTQSKLPSEAPLPLRLVFKLFGKTPTDGARVPLAVCVDKNYARGALVSPKGKQGAFASFIDDASSKRVWELCASLANA